MSTTLPTTTTPIKLPSITELTQRPYGLAPSLATPAAKPQLPSLALHAASTPFNYTFAHSNNSANANANSASASYNHQIPKLPSPALSHKEKSEVAAPISIPSISSLPKTAVKSLPSPSQISHHRGSVVSVSVSPTIQSHHYHSSPPLPHQYQPSPQPQAQAFAPPNPVYYAPQPQPVKPQQQPQQQPPQQPQQQQQYQHQHGFNGALAEVVPRQTNRCHRCGTTETPEWRRGPKGVRTLCNACGLYHAKLVKRKGAALAAEEVLNNRVTKGKNGRRISIKKHLMNESLLSASVMNSRIHANVGHHHQQSPEFNVGQIPPPPLPQSQSLPVQNYPYHHLQAAFQPPPPTHASLDASGFVHASHPPPPPPAQQQQLPHMAARTHQGISLPPPIIPPLGSYVNAIMPPRPLVRQ
ncbi:uncharacterized protein LODBEIA_P26560 [Lodderomyces beijingensis]|uniref:GATA-type domain-containing protein n=1 Tax=Lodderomyces beijingensis TaxID=1775926 RepID=A0ABP0ZQF6_9ASCO